MHSRRLGSSLPGQRPPDPWPAPRRPRGSTPSPRRRSSYGGRIVWALEQDPVHVAPFGAILTSNHWGKQASYDSLVEWDKNLNLHPALAESWKIAADQKSITFNLRKGVKFHNGKELDAGDVKYSVEQMLNPPLPGSISTVGQVPAFLGVDVVSKYVARLNLKARDARVFGFLAWGRYSPIVPAGLYDQINVSRNAIGTGPYRMVGFNPNDRVELVANQSFWKKGLPYMDAMTLKTLPDEQARIAALRAGAIDGATVSSDSAAALKSDSNLVVLKGGTAAFRELQITLKPGETQPYDDVRVRQAVNFAINRQAIIDTVYGGNGAYSGHVPPGLRPVAADAGGAEAEVPQVRPAEGEAADVRRRPVEGLLGRSCRRSRRRSTSAGGVGDQVAAEGRSTSTSTSSPRSPARSPANNGVGNFAWDLTARGMRGDIDGYLAEFNPSAPIYRIWYPEWKNPKVWRDVGNGRITLDPAKRLPLYKDAQRLLLNDFPQIPLVQVQKFQVVRKRVQGMYVAFDDFNTGLRNTVWLNS